MDNHQNDEIEIDLRELFLVLVGKLWIIILSGVICVTAAGLITRFAVTPMYTSTSKLYVVSKSTSLTSLADIQLGTSLTQDYMVMITSRPVTEKVIENLDLDMTHDELVGTVTVTNPSDTRILEISVSNADPKMAQNISNEFANVSSTRMAEIMDTQKPNVVEDAYLPEEPSSPSLKKNVAIAGLLGVFAAAALIILLHLMNESITTEEDVEKYLGLSTLGTIPMSEGERKIDAKKKKLKKKAGGSK